jgi:hypothetical protein
MPQVRTLALESKEWNIKENYAPGIVLEETSGI